jgi:N-acetylated-alpha-linked acidic dipeptidase
MMEEARGVAELLKAGWRPKRTLVYAAWDGEEPGLLGSTEWVETHAEVLRKNAAVYVNSDSNSRGFLGMAGSHSLENFINEVSRDVVDPEKKISVFERARAARLVTGSAEERKEARDHSDLRIGALGSGSDYTPFLQHLGVASLNLAYSGEGGGGEYHSLYDSFDHYTRFGDPTFDYGIALAQTAGRVMLRLANADVLPFEFLSVADTLGRYVTEISKLTDDMRNQTTEKNRQIQEGILQAYFDPERPYVLPKPKPEVPTISFKVLQDAVVKLQASSKRFSEQVNRRRSAGHGLSPSAEEALDQILFRSERALTRDGGLPKRPWFKHQIYAPGLYTGYGVKTLPAVREAIEQRDWTQARDQIVLVAQTIEAFSHEVDRATAVVKSNLAH